MRVTHRFSTLMIKSNLSNRLGRMENAWRHASSGKQVERPSDDPAATARILSYRSLMSEVAQRRFQTEQGLSILQAADTALDQAGQIITKAQELALASGSGSASAEDRQIMMVEVDQLIAQLEDIAKENYDDRKLFAAGASNFSATDMADLRLEDATIFDPARAALTKLKDELALGNQASDQTLGDLKTAADNMLSFRTEVGARANRLESVQNRLLVMEQDLTTRRSLDEEVDLARAMVDLKEEESAYQAALSATARVMQVSLVDYL